MAIRIFEFLRFLPILLALAGCASNVTQFPTEFTPAAVAEPHTLKTLAKQVDIKLDTGYSRSLKRGSQWTRIGTVAQGDVCKPYMDVFTLEGAHIHEAYLVISGGYLVGFYLPVERSFSPLKKSIPFAINP